MCGRVGRAAGAQRFSSKVFSVSTAAILETQITNEVATC